jgi:hypothetical protein
MKKRVQRDEASCPRSQSQDVNLNLNLKALGQFHSAVRLEPEKKTRPNLNFPAGLGECPWVCKDRSLSVPGEMKSLEEYTFNYAKWLRKGAVWLIVILFLMNELPFLKELE